MLNEALTIPMAPAEILLPNSVIKLDERSDNVDCNSPKLTSYLEEMSVRNVEKLLIGMILSEWQKIVAVPGI